MPRPPSALRQMNIGHVSTWEGARMIDQIVAEAEQGHFYSAALFADQVLGDDRIRGVMSTRISGLLGKPIEFEPAKDTAQGRKIAEDVESAWPSIFEHAALVELATWGLLLGVGVGQVVWDSSDGPWMPCLNVWHPSALRWDEEARQYLAQTRNGEVPVTPGDGRWVLFTPFGLDYAGRRGLLRSLGRLYLFRQWTLRDWARYSEVHGMPTRVGISPASGDKAADEEFRRKLAKLGAEPSITVRQGEEGNRYDLKLVEAMGKSHESFASQLAMLDRNIAVLILGQAQSTEGQAGLGSNDQAGEPVRLDVMRADGDALSDMLRHQVLEPYCRYEWNAPNLAPWPKWQIDPPEDKAQKALELSTLGDALDKLVKYGVDVRAILEETGLPLLAQAVTPAAATVAELVIDETMPAADAPQDAAATGGTVQAKSDATLSLTPSDLASIVKVDEGRSSIGLSPIGGAIGDLWVREHSARLGAELPVDPMVGPPDINMPVEVAPDSPAEESPARVETRAEQLSRTAAALVDCRRAGYEVDGAAVLAEAGVTVTGKVEE